MGGADVLSHAFPGGVFWIDRTSTRTAQRAADLITEHYNLSPDEIIESLRRVELFKGLPDDQLRALVEVIKGFKAGPGDRLFDEGDEDDRFFVVIEGAVEIVGSPTFSVGAEQIGAETISGVYDANAPSVGYDSGAPSIVAP